jgi:hypothetical protein
MEHTEWEFVRNILCVRPMMESGEAEIVWCIAIRQQLLRRIDAWHALLSTKRLGRNDSQLESFCAGSTGA